MMLFENPPFIIWYSVFLAAVIGLVMGSFLNCYAIRICHGEKITHGRSHCMNCGHPLGVTDLVPLFSWLFLHGKCRYCKKPISIRYPLSEFVSMVMFIVTVCRFGISIKTAEALLLTSLLLVISFADLEDFLIPDRFILAGIGIRIVFILFSDPIGKTALDSLIGGLAVSVPVLLIVLIMEKVMKREAMGGGDIKLFFMVGLYLTWKTDLLMVLMACVIGLLFALLSRKRSEPFPFGPSIAAASWIAYLFGQTIVDAYLSLF